MSNLIKDSYKSSRFIAFMAVLASANVLVWFDKIEGMAWGAAVGAVIAAFYTNRAYVDGKTGGNGA